MKPIIGFIGLGDMGRPMACHLLKNGFEVISCANRRREAIEALKLEGLQEVDNPRLVGERADILMTIVVDQDQTEQVLRGDEGALTAMRPGSTIVVMSTLAPGYCQELAEAASAKNVSVLDCPVSGGAMSAESGTLAMIVGGDATVLEKCRAALETMGAVFHCGDVGMGMVAKLANNGLLIGTIALLVEVRAMAKAYGMDLSTLMEVFKNSTGNSFVVQGWERVVSNWGHLALLSAKDVNLCRDAGQSKSIGMPTLDTWVKTNWAAIKPEDL